MKKKFIVGIVLAAMAALLVSVPVFADEPDEVNVSWSGSGQVAGNVDTGDSNANFYSRGNGHAGTFKATDSNNNPYGYGVDSASFSLDTDIAGGGEAWLNVNRVNSKTSSYGPGGQQSHTYVGTDDGDASLQNRSSTNFAGMKDGNYGWNSNDHINVTGSNYILERYMDSDSSDGNWDGGADFAGLLAGGSGSADLDCMSSEANGGGVRLGWGCGCYTNADFTATGTGTFNLNAMGDTSASTAMAPGMSGASSFNFIANWTNSTFTVPDYSTTAQ